LKLRALAGALVVIVAILVGASLYVFRSTRELPHDLAQDGRALLHELGEVARAFKEGTLTTSFVSYATEVSATRRLQVASVTTQESFERKDEMTILWGELSLPDVVVEARAPVEYTYYVEFDKGWSFALDGPWLVVSVPALEFNTPALDVSKLTFVVRKGSILRDEAAVVEQLRLGLTELCRRRAAEHLALTREPARRAIVGFVETWLKDRFPDGGQYRARVVFAGEGATEPVR